MNPIRWAVVNLVVLIVVLAANGAAGSGAMSGESIGVIANRYRSLFLPANYVFGIWSLIYLGQIVSSVFQCTPGHGRQLAARLGPWWTIAGVLNVAWISLFSFSYFAAALVVMVVFLGVLVRMSLLVRDPSASFAARALAEWPFDVYLAWISVALIANSFQYAHVVAWSGFGLPESTWAVVMMAVATILGLIMTRAHGMWLFPVVVAWAVHGIGVRYADQPSLAEPAQAFVLFGLAGGAARMLWLWRTRPTQTTA